MFVDEEGLVESFIRSAESRSPWGELNLRPEFFYQRGRTDVVAVSGEGLVMAFEAKLRRWKIGLHQAYRNRCFADLSYLVLPEDAVEQAARHLDDFALRGVGLCCVTADGILILRDAELGDPIQPWLRRKALDFAESGGGFGGNSTGHLR